jgi:hypothetical protein
MRLSIGSSPVRVTGQFPTICAKRALCINRFKLQAFFILLFLPSQKNLNSNFKMPPLKSIILAMIGLSSLSVASKTVRMNMISMFVAKIVPG